MKQNVLNWMLMAAVMLGLSISVTSCKDDDDDDKNKSEQSADTDPLNTDEARTAFRWICAISDPKTFDENWQSKTFEPVIGAPSEGNAYTRIVVVNDLDEAKVNFGTFADKAPSELNGTVTVAGGAAGTMTWEVSPASAQNLAVVTVNSRIMPHLQKIVYCTEEQTGQNGFLGFGNNMEGTAYYRFGDVICDGDGYYWVCVRPSFAPNNKECSTKGDSHWINIFNAAESGGRKTIPAKNIKDTWNNLAKYNNQTIILPTQLPYNREHIYNLCQLVWAMLNIEDYKNDVLSNAKSALGGFPYDYHGGNFLKAVATYWNEPDEKGYTIWQKLFNHTFDEMKNLREMNIFYCGYSWTWGNDGYLYCYQSSSHLPQGYSGKMSKDEWGVNFKEDGFNIKYFCQEDVNKDQIKPEKAERFTNPSDNTKTHNGYWVVRYSTGEDLMTAGDYNYYNRIGSEDGKMHDVYVFNKKQGVSCGSNVPAMVDSDVKVPTTAAN